MGSRSLEEELALREAEIARLQKLTDEIQTSIRGIPRMGVCALLALPAGILFGFVWALLTVGVTLSMMGTAAYLFYGRRVAYRGQIEMVQRDMQVLRQEHGKP